MNVNIKNEFSVAEFDDIAEKILLKRELESVRFSVLRLIDHLLSNPEQTDKIFRHPLGFLDFPISMIHDTRFKMRLHFWKAAHDGDIVSNIHFHTADILSFVLAGCIQDEQFYLIDEGASSTHEVLRVEYYEGGSRRVPTGREGLPVVDRTQVTSSGGVYFVPRSVFHRSTVKEGQITVTMMIAFNEDPAMSHHALIEKTRTSEVDFQHVRDIGHDDILKVLNDAKRAIAAERK